MDDLQVRDLLAQRALDLERSRRIFLEDMENAMREHEAAKAKRPAPGRGRLELPASGSEFFQDIAPNGGLPEFRG